MEGKVKESKGRADMDRSLVGRPLSNSATALPQSNGFVGIQQAAGNLAIQRMLLNGEVQAKLTVNKPGDIDEQDADRVADMVMHSPGPGFSPRTSLIRTSTMTSALEDSLAGTSGKSQLLLKSVSSSNSAVRSLSSRSTGQSIGQSVSTSAASERQIRRPVSNVQLHKDAYAQQASLMLGAHAFTLGRHIYLGPTVGTPIGPSLDRVLRHELIHVAQVDEGIRHGRIAANSQIERQAHQLAEHGCKVVEFMPELLGASQDAIYRFWPLVMAAAAGLYVLLRPNVANAPGPEDPGSPSVSELQVAGEALALFLVPELIAGRIAIAGASGWRLLAAHSAAGSSALVSYQAVQDIGAREMSSPTTYAVQAVGGALIGVWAFGPARAVMTRATGPRLYLVSAGSGAGMGMTMRAMGDVRQGAVSSPQDYVLWAGGGVLLGLGSAGLVRGGDYLAYRSLIRSDRALSQRMAAQAPLTADEVAHMWAARPDLIGRLSLRYQRFRGYDQFYRGQGRPSSEILSPLARERGVGASESIQAQLLAEGVSLEELAGFTARWSSEAVPITISGAGFEQPGALGIPVTRIPGVGADFARRSAIELGELGQPVLYVIRVPRGEAVNAAALGWGQKSAVEMEHIIFNQVPNTAIIGQAPPPAALPSLRAVANEAGTDILVVITL